MNTMKIEKLPSVKLSHSERGAVNPVKALCAGARAKH